MNRFLDKASFERLFRDEFKGLVFFAVQYVKDYEAAREIVQEAFIGLWNQRERIDPSRQVKSYLSTTVRNRSLNYLRDHKKFDTRLLTQENLYPLASYEQPDRLVEKELQEKIGQAVGELPEKCREIFLLSREEYLKYQEIADRLQISVKTVETQMSKALQHLRSRLREYLVILLLVWLIPPRQGVVSASLRDAGWGMGDVRREMRDMRCGIRETPHHHTTISPYHHTTISPYHHTTIRVSRHFSVIFTNR